jgi:hypothetical protein
MFKKIEILFWDIINILSRILWILCYPLSICIAFLIGFFINAFFFPNYFSFTDIPFSQLTLGDIIGGIFRNIVVYGFGIIVGISAISMTNGLGKEITEFFIKKYKIIGIKTLSIRCNESIENNQKKKEILEKNFNKSDNKQLNNVETHNEVEGPKTNDESKGLMERHNLNKEEAEHVKEIMDEEGLDEDDAVELREDL